MTLSSVLLIATAVLALTGWVIWRQGSKFALIYVSLLFAAPILFVGALFAGIIGFQRLGLWLFTEIRLAIWVAGALVMVACFRPVARMIPAIILYGVWVWLTPAMLLALACLVGGRCL